MLIYTIIALAVVILALLAVWHFAHKAPAPAPDDRLYFDAFDHFERSEDGFPVIQWPTSGPAPMFDRREPDAPDEYRR